MDGADSTEERVNLVILDALTGEGRLVHSEPRHDGRQLHPSVISRRYVLLSPADYQGVGAPGTLEVLDLETGEILERTVEAPITDG